MIEWNIFLQKNAMHYIEKKKENIPFAQKNKHNETYNNSTQQNVYKI